MVEFKWIKVYLCVILVLRFTAITEQKDQFVVVRAGTRATLPCGLEDRDNCEKTNWLFAKSHQTSAVELVRSGLLQTSASSKSRPERMRVTANCSLVVKEVTAQDAGQYCCRQDEDAVVYLSVVNMTEQRSTDGVTLTCSVWAYGESRCTVKWLLKGGDVDEDNGDLKTSHSGCSATVSFKSSHFIYKSENYEPLTCQVTYGFTEKRFPFRPRSSALGDNETTTESEGGWTEQETAAKKPNQFVTLILDWWRRWCIALAVVLAALVITVVAVVRWKWSKGNETQTLENGVDPEDDVRYASILHATNSAAGIWGGEDQVTYSTVGAPSPSAGAAAPDPNSLYTTVNKLNR
ncbi:uncharacterized protein LOC118289854 isoform X2 [Scophthalmus maximus]|uniref:uncharacterized protein LOC118289854 isoform X2 n=1 Tax=Scophthalmus maximus TaxID=52904 RepID=UPI001FA9356A|nr:uncharacterized protein LOC118289854 isoform X2 [Scophthalmus maximus]